MKLTPKDRAKLWKKLVPQLKKDFEKAGIVYCMVCRSTTWLSFAHRKKRRFCSTEEELRKVALICVPCHEVIEAMTHDRMEKTVDKLIDQQNNIAGRKLWMKE